MNKVDARDEVFFDEKVKQTKLLRFIARAVGIQFVASIAGAVGYIGAVVAESASAGGFAAIAVLMGGVFVVVNATDEPSDEIGEVKDNTTGKNAFIIIAGVIVGSAILLLAR